MNKLFMQKVGKKFYGHDTLNSKYEPKIPASAEREYVRTVNAYMAILKAELEAQLPKLKKIYKANRNIEVKENQRNDSLTDLILSISQIFATIKNNIISKTTGFGLRRRLESLAHLNRKLTVKEWKKAIRATLGIDIREDYYLGDFYIEQLQKWVHENVLLISTIPEDTLEKMKDIVYDGFAKGKTTTRMVKEIQRVYGISRRRAELIARDQTAKLNGQIQKAQQQDAGITEYIWSTTGDKRVRKSHQELNGKKFSWSDAPVNSDGRKCHPGQDYQCRCIGRPVFNRNINLPLSDDEIKMLVWKKYGMITENTKHYKYHNIEISEDKINKTDMRAIYDYMSFKSYIINEKLRNEIALTTEEEFFKLKLDTALKKMPRYKGKVQRSLYFYSKEDMLSFITRYEKGKIVIYDEYISMTRGDIYNTEGQVQIYVLECTRGRDISKINVAEQEVIYERGAKFKISEVYFQGGKYYIWMEEWNK